MIVLVFLLLLAFGLYLLPGIIAQTRNVRNTGSIWVINIFLGWTAIGWIIALAMAARSAEPPTRPPFPPAPPHFLVPPPVPGPPPSQLENPEGSWPEISRRSHGLDGD